MAANGKSDGRQSLRDNKFRKVLTMFDGVFLAGNSIGEFFLHWRIFFSRDRDDNGTASAR